ncbi:hypothetical protein [Streptomyces flavofungini]|uniref:hypothetical protein n=1 Tax=Streptomyces flavofungini TaxID=68200 RepID=UPI0025B04183|nr:hypothetical protein [Streptomyces flavofungini]WJV48864.1 hypothetical protein QUY26_27155 [Streptomyces flavofungini]
MHIELGRVLARLEESGGVPNVRLTDGEVVELLGALAVVDPKKVESQKGVSSAVDVAA